ncbi:hypothetical protein AB0F77_03705 [Streptomyces sp. NPDC026672]|uniref:hypothetical protein n=1 Tax=unclassified Streptomyces TaxID=2593676 RepID=UPI0033EA5D8B
MARASWTSGNAPSRPARRRWWRRTGRPPRAQGRHGPRLRDVLPALVAVAAGVCALAAALAAGYRSGGIGVPVAGVLALLLLVVFAVRRARPGARRRRGYYTPDELSELDTQGLALAVARMLRRDGWRVRFLPAPDRPRLRARDADGRHVDVAFRPVAEPLPDEHPPPGDPEPDFHLVVHRGTFAERDRRWAHRDGTTRLLDGPLLRRWAGGTRLTELITPTA